MVQGIELRQHRRRVYRGPGQLVFEGRAPITVQMDTISEGGVGVVSKVNLPDKQLGKIRFIQPGKFLSDPPVTVQIRVAHVFYSNKVEGFMVGMQFMQELPAPLRLAIQTFVSDWPV